MRLIIAGFGNVGAAFAKIVSENMDWLRHSYGLVPRVVAIIDSQGAITNPEGIKHEELAARSNHPVSDHPVHGHKGASVLDVLKDVEADVFLEFTPTNLMTGQPGLGHIEAAMNKGLNVITTNKGPLAVAMPALLELARYRNVEFQFSGTVGGGTPILQLAKDCLAGNRILSVEGILNGTTNYILTRMHEAHVSLQDALAEAQRLGYAEADPKMDVEGFDTAAKLVILTNWAIGARLSLKDLTIQGISQVTADQINEAKHKGGEIKLVGSAGAGKASVKPQTVQTKNPLCVSDALNAITFETEFAGKVTLVGYGSGGRETAAAALRDLVSIKQVMLDGNAS